MIAKKTGQLKQVIVICEAGIDDRHIEEWVEQGFGFTAKALIISKPEVKI